MLTNVKVVWNYLQKLKVKSKSKFLASDTDIHLSVILKYLLVNYSWVDFCIKISNTALHFHAKCLWTLIS